MKKGIVIKPYWGYIKKTDLTFKQSVDIYRENNSSSFVVTTWDMEMLNKCVKFK